MMAYYNDKDGISPCNHWYLSNMFDNIEKYDALSRM